jgi:hypothetical protein
MQAYSHSNTGDGIGTPYPQSPPTGYGLPASQCGQDYRRCSRARRFASHRLASTKLKWDRGPGKDLPQSGVTGAGKLLLFGEWLLAAGKPPPTRTVSSWGAFPSLLPGAMAKSGAIRWASPDHSRVHRSALPLPGRGFRLSVVLCRESAETPKPVPGQPGASIRAGQVRGR